jgi:hypothetical protein
LYLVEGNPMFKESYTVINIQVAKGISEQLGSNCEGHLHLESVSPQLFHYSSSPFIVIKLFNYMIC